MNIQFLEPYYDSIETLRTQIDISQILRKFIFLDRVSRTVLDDHQRDLLYVIEKEDIKDIKRELENERAHKNLKLHLNNNEVEPQNHIEPKSVETIEGSNVLDPQPLGKERRFHSKFRMAYK